MRKNYIKFLLFLFVFALGTVASYGVVSAEELQPGEVKLSKSAKLVDNKVNIWDIEVKVEGRGAQSPSDTVLVFDYSNSMNQGQRLAKAKAAANSFVDELLANPDSGNRIALIGFGNNAEILVNYTNNSTTLKSAINSIIAPIEGTFTQDAIEKATVLLNDSSTVRKQMVILSDGYPTFSYSLNDTSSSSGNYVQTGSYYETKKDLTYGSFNHSSRAGDGTDLRTYISGSGNYYYNHGNSAIAAATWAKNADIPIYTIAFEADSVGTDILNQIASPSKAFSATEEDLRIIFDEIAASILTPVNDASVSDLIGRYDVGFKLVDGSISVSQGNYSVSTNPEKIDWMIGDLTLPDDSETKSATMNYQVEVDNEYDFDIDKISGVHKTNGETTITYNDWENQEVTDAFISPEVDPIFIIITKELYNSHGTKLTDEDTFVANVTGPNNFDKDYTIKNGNYKTISSELRDVGEYTVTEKDSEGYIATIEISNESVDNFNVVKSESTVKSMSDINVLLVNREYEGMMNLSVEKIWEDNNDQYKLRPDKIEVTIVGENTKEEFSATIEGDEWIHTFENIPSDVYTIKETSVEGYTSKVDVEENNVKLTNTLDVMDLTIEKIWKDNKDKLGKRPKSVEVVILKDDVEFSKVKLNVKNDWKVDLKGFPVGKYTIKELNIAKGYTSAVNNNGKADQNNTEVIVTNTYKKSNETPRSTPDTGQNLLYFTLILLTVSGIGLRINKYLK